MAKKPKFIIKGVEREKEPEPTEWWLQEGLDGGVTLCAGNSKFTQFVVEISSDGRLYRRHLSQEKAESLGIWVAFDTNSCFIRGF